MRLSREVSVWYWDVPAGEALGSCQRVEGI